MSLDRPAADCGEIAFTPGVVLTPPAQVALEDYARVLTGAGDAETMGGDDAMTIIGVHLCALPAPVRDAAHRDVVEFARDLAARESSGGLGWS